MKQNLMLPERNLYQPWKSVFQLLRTICCVYLAISIPLRLAFVTDFKIGKNFLGFVISDFLSTLFFSIEIMSTQVGLRGGCVLPVEEIPSSLSRFSIFNAEASTRQPLYKKAPNWISSNVIASTLMTLPLEYISLILKIKNVNILLLNRAFRVLHLPWYLSDIAQFLEDKHIIKNIGLQRTWKLFFAMALAGHWCGCIFFLVARHEARDGVIRTWPQEQGIFVLSSNDVDMTQSAPNAYIKSLYWAYITMITTGFGDIVPISIPETIWCIFSMYIGVVITTCTIANLQLLVTNMDAALTGFQHKLELLKRYMQYRKLPGTLQNRIISYYDYQWDILKGADEEKFLEELPRSLQQQVANFLYKDLISSLPALRKANNALLNALTECSEMSIYSPNDEILRPGEQLRGALLISRGEVEILNGIRVERKMQRFDRYAEESLFQEKVNKYLVRSKTFSEVFLLPACDFQTIITSQCDSTHILQMKETALTQAKMSTKANKMFGSAEDTTPSHGFNKHCHPDSLFRIIWDCIMMLGLLYYTCSLPLSLMKSLQTFSESDTALFIIGYLVDFLFVIDTIFKYNYFMFIEEGIIQHHKERIRDNFIHHHKIWREAFSMIPLELMIFVYGPSYLHFFRVTKIIRLLDIPTYVTRAEKILGEFKFGMNQSLHRIIKLNILMVVVCHWVGCLWYLSADVSVFLGSSDNWRESDERNTSNAVSHSDLRGFSGYLRSIYWAIVGMSTVGYGDIIPTNVLETTVATVVILFGGLFLPAVVGGLAAYMGNLNFAKKNYKAKNKRIQSYMRRSRIRRNVVDKVVRYYDYLWSCQGGVDEQNIMNELSGTLWDKVAMHLNGEDINSITFFSSCDDRTKNHIVALLRPRVFLPGDVITYQGEVGKEMFLIERGHVVVKDIVHEIDLCILGKGDYFGESCLLSGTLRIANVFAITYCDCFVLTKDDFNEAMEMIMPIKRQMILASIKKVLRQKQETNVQTMNNFIWYPKCLRVTEGSNIFNYAEKNIKRNAKFNPDSSFRRIWNAIILAMTTYNAWIIPFRLSFINSQPMYIVDWFFDIFFIIDMYLKYCEFSYVEQGELVCDREKVKRHYLKNSFLIDAIASLPFDFLIICIDQNHDSFALILAVLRIPKFIRLSKLLELVGDVFRALEDTNIYLAPLQLFELLSGVILIAHWAACGFYALARRKNNHDHCDENYDDTGLIVDWGNERVQCMWINTWVQKQIVDGRIPPEGGNTWQLYLRAFNWALPTLVVVVIGDVVPITSEETLYVFLWMVIGVTINATIIGNVANLVANLETESSEFVKKADDIKQFMHINGVKQELQNRIDQFMDYIWTRHGGIPNEAHFIKELPLTLQIEITDQTRVNLIKDCVYFDFCSDEIVKALTLCLKPVIFSVGDVLIHAGDMGQEMYFLDKGSVDVVSPDGKTLYATLHDGSFFGETSLFFKQKRSSTVKASTFCEVFQLDKIDLDNELRQRDFDLSRMFDMFTSIANSNKRRNDAVAANLKASKKKGHKLSRMIFIADEAVDKWKHIQKIFLPHSNFRAIWEISSMMFSIYFIVAIPYRVAFILDEEVSKMVSWIVIDSVIDCFFVIDIILRYRYFGYNHDGKIILNKERIKNHYLQNGMFLDVISCLPLEVVTVWVGLEHFFVFRLIHFIRGHRLPYYFARIEHFLNLWKIRISSATNLLLRMFFYYVMVNHWCCCVWFIIHRYFERDVQFTWATSDCPGSDAVDRSNCISLWDDAFQQHNICNKNSIHKCYIRSFYFVTTTISTVGYGDIAPVTEIETLWENIVVLIGASFFAGIIGAFTTFLSQNDTSGSNAFLLKLQKLQEYMHYRNLPQQLQNEILIYHKHKWNETRVLDVHLVLNILSRPLQMDLSFEVTKHVFSCVPILSSYEKIIQKRIAYAFMLQMSPSNSNIYSVGDIGWDIYFIGAGLIQITLPVDLSTLDADGRANANRTKQKAIATGLIYKRGNHFGESCLLSESGVRQETITSKTTSELYLISKDDLESIWSYAVEEDREKMRNDLLVRNGNTWHFFDELNHASETNCNDSLTRKGTSSTISQLRSNRRSMKQTSILTGNRRTKFNSNRNATIKNKRKNVRFNKEWVRLRSFSAAASTEAMNKIAQHNLSKNPKSSLDNIKLNTSTPKVDKFRGLKEIFEIQSVMEEGVLAPHNEVRLERGKR